MLTQGMKETSIIGLIGFVAVGGLGFITGLMANPIIDSMEKIDVKNQLAVTESELANTEDKLVNIENEITAKTELTNNFCNQFEGVK